MNNDPQDQSHTPGQSNQAWRDFMTQDEPKTSTTRASGGGDRRNRVIGFGAVLAVGVAAVALLSGDSWAVDRVCDQVRTIGPSNNGVQTTAQTQYNFVNAANEIKAMTRPLVLHPHLRKAVRNLAGDIADLQNLQNLQTMMARGLSQAGDIDATIALIDRTDGHVRTAQAACDLPIKGAISAADRAAVEALKDPVKTTVPVRPTTTVRPKASASATPSADPIPAPTGVPGSPRSTATPSAKPSTHAGPQAAPRLAPRAAGTAVTVDEAAITLVEQQLSEDQQAFQESLASATVSDIERQLDRFYVEADMEVLANLRAGKTGEPSKATQIRGLDLQVRESQEKYQRVLADPSASAADRESMAATVTDLQSRLRKLRG